MSALALTYEASFSDRVSELLQRIDFRVVDNDDDLDGVFRLRYDAYMREGNITKNASQKFSDEYDESENVLIYGLYFYDSLVSSIRIHVASKTQPTFPSFSVFQDLLEPELESGKIIIDPTRFVTDKEWSRELTGLPHVTLRLCWLAAEHFEAEHFLVAVRPEHQAFYRRTFNHRPICGARSYPLLKAPISLMTVDQSEVADKVHRRYPFFRSTFFERRMLFDRRVLEPVAARRAAHRPSIMPAQAAALRVPRLSETVNPR
ncbi:MAG: hypothetical protein MI753_04385 [Hyphomicrobiales bacterium]|nr:hypothetical protein [Hyphomicrobiales bacterium]